MILNNNIINIQSDYWETENGYYYYFENDNGEIIDENNYYELDIDEQEKYYEYYLDIFQYFIISDSGAEFLKNYTDEIVLYNEKLDIYLWGITHYGASWDYVLTDIKIEINE